MQTQTHTFRGTEFSLTIARGTLAVTLDLDASARWGAHLDAGVETPDLGDFRRAAQREVMELAEKAGCGFAEIYATMPDAADWLIDQLEIEVD